MGNPRTSTSTWTLKSFASLSSLSLLWLPPKATPNPTGAVTTVVMAVMATDTLAATTDTDTDTLENEVPKPMLMPKPMDIMAVDTVMAEDTVTVDTVDTVMAEDTARDLLMLNPKLMPLPMLTTDTTTEDTTVDTTVVDTDTVDTVVDTTGDKRTDHSCT